MFSYAALTGYCWVIFLVVWFVLAFTAKKSIRNTRLRRSLAIRYLVIAVLIFIYFRFYAGQHVLNGVGHYGSTTSDPAILTLGLIVCAAGIALAIWARVYLGRNWGMPMTQREHPELVTTGPYAYTRNPLYLGSLLMGLGFAAAARSWWVGAVLLLMFFAIYLPVIRDEEAFLRQKFPEFDAYARRVPRLFPTIPQSSPNDRPDANGFNRAAFSLDLYLKHAEYNALVGVLAMLAGLLLKMFFFRS